MLSAAKGARSTVGFAAAPVVVAVGALAAFLSASSLYL